MQDLTISIQSLRALVEPVMPFACGDYELPVINSVRVESRGKYLIAFATDRFRLGCQRIAAEEGADWPEWSATIPLPTLRAIFQTYKAKRFSTPTLTLTVDAGTLRVHGDEALVDLLDASVTYPLIDGQFPKVTSFFTKALANTETDSYTGFNPKLLADFAKVTKAPALAMRITSPTDPVLFTDGEDFIALLMPRKREGRSDFPVLSDWTDVLADPEPAPKPKRTRKSKAVA